MRRKNQNYLSILFIASFCYFLSISSSMAEVSKDIWEEALLKKALESFDQICREFNIENPVSAKGHKGYDELTAHMKKSINPESVSINVIPKTPFEISFSSCHNNNPPQYDDCMAMYLEAYANEIAINVLSNNYGIIIIYKNIYKK